MTDQTPSPSDKRNRFPRIRLTNWQIILIALVMVGGRLVLDFSQRIIEGQQKLEEQRILEVELTRLREEQIALEAAKAYYSSPAFIEAWAHDQGKMVREGEILVVPQYSELESSPQNTANLGVSNETLLLQLPPWQVWWALFFDVPPPASDNNS